MVKKKYIHQDLLVSASMLSIGIIFFVGSFFIPRFEEAALNISAFPMIVSLALIIFSLFNVTMGIKKTRELNMKIELGEDVIKEISIERLKYPLICIIFMTAYVILIPTIGFFVSSMVFLFAFIYYLGYRKPFKILAIIIGMEVFIYYLFVVVLNTRLPKGMFF
ncbi:MAG: tripartite tricarboxylate transporter TctB family protein [Dethiosulfatibacter sp.]|nr:tripartite tricarboxylate transporter TctB family protein [Dethiosulfatibacter sp.]